MTEQTFKAELASNHLRRADFVSPIEETGFDNGRFVFDGVSAKPTKLFMQQVAAQTGIGGRYMKTMMDEGGDANDLIAQNYDYWAQKMQGKNRLVRTFKKVGDKPETARAWLSGKYLTFDNNDVLNMALPALQDGNFESTALHCDERGMTLKMFTLNNDITVKTKINDVIKVGLMLRNSEVGGGALIARPFAMRVACLNGQLLDVADKSQEFRRLHQGANLTPGIQASEETLDLHGKAMQSGFKDVIQYWTTPGNLQRIGQTIQKTVDSDDVASITAATQEVGRLNNLTEDEIAQGIELFAGDERTTGRGLFGLSQMVAAVAKTATTMDRATELERISGTLYNLKPSEYRRISQLKPETTKVFT